MVSGFAPFDAKRSNFLPLMTSILPLGSKATPRGFSTPSLPVIFPSLALMKISSFCRIIEHTITPSRAAMPEST